MGSFCAAGFIIGCGGGCACANGRIGLDHWSAWTIRHDKLAGSAHHDANDIVSMYDGEETSQVLGATKPADHAKMFQSRVASISSKNLGGVTSANGQDIRVEFPPEVSFVACTGETGSGKSLLLAKAVELVCGGKAAKAVGPNVLIGRRNSEIVAEMEFVLNQPHLSMIQDILETNDVTIDGLEKRLHCKRSISLQAGKQASPGKYRLRSVCEINGHVVTLQLLSSVVAPLVAIVDGSKAASALGKPEVKASILDAAVPTEVLVDVAERKAQYWKLRKARAKLQAALDDRILPKGFSLENEDDAKLISHWINELDAFKSRVTQLCKSFDVVESKKSGILALIRQLSASEWMDGCSSDVNVHASTLYNLLTNLRDKLRSLDNRLVAANNAVHVLTLLSSKESVLTALERTRSFVNEASDGDLEDETILDAAEQCHDLLNSVEEATIRCAQHVEDDSNGLIQRLESERSLCPVSVEVIDGILHDWGGLARKHGVSPSSLPACHRTLIAEQSGSNEALAVLAELAAKEQKALDEFVESCFNLTEMRQHVAEKLCQSVNRRLPTLGMKPTFDILIDSSRFHLPDKLVSIGPNDVDFLVSQNSPTKHSKNAQGQVHVVASSGEKARILLAIECAIPGSVATACMKGCLEVTDEYVKRPLPVLVLYDEIDAHVGGNAATAIAQMLLEQASTHQVIAITHNPAVAAIADHHIMVQRLISFDDDDDTETLGTPVSVKSLACSDRTQELARMAAGNLALEEAEAFASALIRDGANMRRMAGPQG